MHTLLLNIEKILGDFLWFIFKPQNCESLLVPNCFIIQYTTCSNNVNAIIIIKFCYQLLLRKVLLASGYLNSNIANSSFQQKKKRGQNDPLRSVMNFIKAFKLISKTLPTCCGFYRLYRELFIIRLFFISPPFCNLQPIAPLFKVLHNDIFFSQFKLFLNSRMQMSLSCWWQIKWIHVLIQIFKIFKYIKTT